jgi:hypothetical protein
MFDRGVSAVPFAYRFGAAGGPATSAAAKSRLPLSWRAIVAFDVKAFVPPAMHSAVQPSVYAT